MGELIDPVESILIQLNIMMRVTPELTDTLSGILDQRFKIETVPDKLINMTFLEVKNYVNYLLRQKLNIVAEVTPKLSDALSERLDQKFEIETVPFKLIGMNCLDVKNYVNHLLRQKEKVFKRL